MNFAWGFLAGAVVVGATGLWLVSDGGTGDRDPIMFPQMSFWQGKGFVSFDGSLYGEGEDRPVNNFYMVRCWQHRMECDLMSMDQLGDNFVGGIYDDTIPINTWSDGSLVASSRKLAEENRACNWFEIRVNRKTEEVDYIRYPNPTAKDMCREWSQEKVMRWRFDNGRAYSSNANGAIREKHR